MKHNSVRLVVYNFTYLLKLCDDNSDLKRGKDIHGSVITSGFSWNLFAMTGVVNMYVKCKQINDVYNRFDRMPERDMVALMLVLRMSEEGHMPDLITIVFILPAIADIGLLKIGIAVHGNILRAGFEPLVNVSTALVDMYSACGSMRIYGFGIC
uniref:Pentatricopeptide repeat-containing protein n=1 Tax=Salix viminalis TaxID=40686 RepID=A0A6N2LU00_SALVM